MKIIVKDLACIRDDRLLFKNLNFSLQNGQIGQIIGQNGAGKTSLLRMLAGLLDVMQGQIFINDVEINKIDKYEFNNNILYLGYKAQIRFNLTVLENWQFLASLKGIELTANKITEIAEVLQLKNFLQTPTKMLSAGQKRKVLLAQMFYQEIGKIWFLDEPFTALDMQTCDLIEKQMQKHLNNQGVILFISHQPLINQFNSYQQIALKPQ